MKDASTRRLLVGLAIATALLTGVIRSGPGFAASRIVLELDSTARDFSQSHRTRGGDVLARVLRGWGEPEAYLPIVGSLLWLGWYKSNRRWLYLARRVAGTLALAALVCWALKLTVGRERPRWSDDPAVFHPFTRADSYPSGHTTVAVALSASLAESIVSPAGTAALYLLAGGTAWSRVNDNRHWTSDVLAGALIALMASLQVRRRWPTHT